MACATLGVIEVAATLTRKGKGLQLATETLDQKLQELNRDWQSFVVSPRAKAKIRQWFAKERREEALESGKDAIAKEVRRGGLPLQRLMNAESMAALARELRYADVSALYTAVGEGHVSARHVVQRLVAQFGGDISGLVPPGVAQALPQKLAERK